MFFVDFYIIYYVDHTACHDYTCLHCKQQGSRARLTYCFLNKLTYYIFLFNLCKLQSVTYKLNSSSGFAGLMLRSHEQTFFGKAGFAQSVAKGSVLLQADSEDSDQTGRMPGLICLRWAHMPLCWFCCEAAHLNSLACSV